MAAGRYRHRITIEQPSRTTDADGLPVSTWSTYAIVWSAATISGSGQSVHHRQQQSRAASTFVVRWSSLTAGIVPAMRIIHAGETYHVESAEPGDGPRREIVIQATAKRGADG